MLEDGDDFSGWQPMQCSTCKYFEETGVFVGTCHFDKTGEKRVRGNNRCPDFKDNRALGGE